MVLVYLIDANANFYRVKEALHFFLYKFKQALKKTYYFYC